MGTPPPIVVSTATAASDPITARVSPLLPLPPPQYTVVEYSSSNNQFITQDDLLEDGGIRYVIRRHLMSQHNQLLEDLNFGNLFDRRDATGDVTIICAEYLRKQSHSSGGVVEYTDNCEYVPLKAHRFVLVRSSAFFQQYFESLVENTTTACILMPGISPSTMKFMLHMFYTGQVFLKFDEMTQFWNAAGTLKIRHVEPSYKWIYYVETLEPVTDNQQVELSSNHVAYENPLPYIPNNTAVVAPQQHEAIQEPMHATSVTAPPITIAIPPTVSSVGPTATSAESSTHHPIVILRPLGHPVLPMPVVTTAPTAVEPIFYLADQQHSEPSATTAGIPISTAGTTPPSPSLLTSEDLTMQMLSANPDQRCRLYYPAVSETEEDSSTCPEQSVILTSTTSNPSSFTSIITTSSSVRPHVSTHSATSINNVVMCPVCLSVIKKERFAAHKKVCNVFGHHSSSSSSSDDKPFVCAICDKSFATKHGLAAHKPFHKKKNGNGTTNTNSTKSSDKTTATKLTSKKNHSLEKRRPSSLSDPSPPPPPL